MFETKRRTIAKAASWRVIATFITTGLALILTGSAETAIEIGILDVIIKLAAYYGHERACCGFHTGDAVPRTTRSRPRQGLTAPGHVA